MCRRNVLLEYLGEESSNTAPAENGCCDVSSSDFQLIDYRKEVLTAIQAVQEISNYGDGDGDGDGDDDGNDDVVGQTDVTMGKVTYLHTCTQDCIIVLDILL